MSELHPVQARILRELFYYTSRRFSELMSVSGLTSDDFKFHIRKLVKLGLIEKNTEGRYTLTATGKELANRFDYDKGVPIRQPKITTAVIVYRTNPDTKGVEYLFQQRKRHPFFGYWGVIGQPVRWGELFEEAAASGLLEQTGFTAPLKLEGFYRQTDEDQSGVGLLEDKVFVVFSADWQGQAAHDWPYAKNEWMDADRFSQLENRFDSCVDMLAMLASDQLQFAGAKTSYASRNY